MSLNVETLFASRMTNMRPSLVRELLKNAAGKDVIAFAGGLPNPAFFPTAALTASTAAVLSEDPAGTLQYAMSEGHPALREWIAARYKLRYGLDIPIEQILITSGSQQGLDLIAKVLLNPGDAVINERPGYQGAIHALSMYQPRFAGVTLNEDGLDVAQLRETITTQSPKFVIITPNYQNPTGITYTEENRSAIAETVGQHNALLVEDDPYSELGFGNKHAPTMRAWLPEQSICLGSFSKIVAPGMRLGWVIAPATIMPKLVIAKQATDMHTNQFAQRVLLHYLQNNPVDEHIARIRKGYAAQAKAMMKAIDQHFPAGIHRTTPDGGMFVWLTLPEGLDSMAILKDAIAQKVTFLPGVPFFTDGGGKRFMRLSYSMCSEAKIDEGIQRLSRVVLRHLDAPA
jgi:2-aminoadipate transaminase